MAERVENVVEKAAAGAAGGININDVFAPGGQSEGPADRQVKAPSYDYLEQIAGDIKAENYTVKNSPYSDAEIAEINKERGAGYMRDFVRVLAGRADKDDSGTVTKDELVAFHNESTNQDVKDLTAHVIKNFDKFASLAKPDWGEITDPKARALVEKYLKDDQADDVISKSDVDRLAMLSKLGAYGHFAPLDVESAKAVKEAGLLGILSYNSGFGSKPIDAYNTFKKTIDERIKVRTEILDWKK